MKSTNNTRTSPSNFSLPTKQFVKSSYVQTRLSKVKQLTNNPNHIPYRPFLVRSIYTSESSRKRADCPSQTYRSNPATRSPLVPSQLTTPRNPFQEGSHSIGVKCKVVYKSQVGSQNGLPKKHNQDNFLIKSNVLSDKSQHLFAVFDGHGKLGHTVSKLLRDLLGTNFEEALNLTNESQPNTLKMSIAKTVRSIEYSSVDTSLSGSTLVAVYIRGKKLCCANIGDSRAVLGRLHTSWDAIDLSRDHKPDATDEKMRILKFNGKVRPFYNLNMEPVGPERVWLENDRLPGLAMSRSVGDKLAHTVGVISTPEIKVFSLSPSDKFIILASDGLWEFVNSQYAVNIVGKALENDKTEEVCQILEKEATKRWKQHNCSIDDITILVIFFNI